MILRKNHHKDNILIYAFYVIVTISVMFMFMSCHVSRQIQTSHSQSDSLVTRVRDSIKQVVNHLEFEHEQQIRQITASGVTFNPTPCPDLSAIRASLDSMGKINFDNAVMKDSLKMLRNKVSIDRNGAIKAEGAITAAYRTNSMITEENTRLAKINDSLWVVHDSDVFKLHKVADVKTLVVKKTFIPWWLWCIAGLGFVLWFYKLIPKRPI